MSSGFSGGVDGSALQLGVAKVSEPNVTFERDELQRKLEMREIDMVRKEKELHHANLEILRMQKENKLAAAEIQNLRDRNETLQQSLMNSRLLSQNARNDAEHVLNESRIRELEAALSAGIHKIKKSEKEIEVWQQKWKDVDGLYSEAMAELNHIKDTKNEHMAELETAYAKVTTAESLVESYERDADRMRNEIAQYQMDNSHLRNTIEDKQRLIDIGKADLAEAKGDVTKLKAILNVRAETNSVLRQQLEEMEGNAFVITKADMDKYKRLEWQHSEQVTKIKDLNKSLMLQMDISNRAETNMQELREKHEATANRASALNDELMSLRHRVTNTGDREKLLKREVIKLRKEKATLAGELTELQNDPYTHDEEVKKMRETLEGTSKARQEEFEEKVKESRRRKVAEESLTALRNRISYLLEQQEQSSLLAAQWQEQKTVFKSELEALHDINNGLRLRLVQLQGEFVNRHVPQVVETIDRYESGVKESKDDDSDRLLLQAPDVFSGKSGKGLDALGPPFDKGPAHAFPNSVESFVERSLFDAICAFSSGKRLKPSTHRKSGSSEGFKLSKPSLNVKKPAYVVQKKSRDDNKLEIGLTSVVAAKGKEAEEAAASELLVGTQINAFLNFCQSRPSERVATLWAEKICALLNFVYSYVQDMTDQLGSSRLDFSQMASKVAVMDQRVQNLRLKYSLERTSKQKNALKYVREQMRMSDLRILLQDLVTKANDQREEMEMTGVAFSESNKTIVAILHEVEQVCRELSLAGASSGTSSGGPGVLEIRLPDSEIDDETVHSLVGLLAGGMHEVKTQDEDEPIHLEKSKEDGPKLSTGSSMMHSRVLTKAIRAISKDYLSRIVMLNLKGNKLTDISCRTLARLIEHSHHIRMVDLRENNITDEGAKVIFDAVRKNSTIMYVTQRQNGFMVEGHREIQGVPGAKSNVEETREEMDRMLNAPKFPLRVDMRYNSAVTEQLDDMFEYIDYSVFQQQYAGNEKIQLTEDVQNSTLNKLNVLASPSHPYAYSESPRGTRPGVSTPQKYSTANLADSPYMNSHTKDNSVQAAKMNAARVSWSPNGFARSAELELRTNKVKSSTLADLNNNVKAGKVAAGQPPRPQSASAISRNRVAIGQGSFQRTDDFDEEGNRKGKSDLRALSTGEHVTFNGTGSEDHSGLIDLIENTSQVAGDAGSLVDSQIRRDASGLGTMLDGEIRDMISTGNDQQSNGGDDPTRKKKKSLSQTVKEKILNGTKRIYNNKNMFKEMGEQESLLDIMKKQNIHGKQKIDTTIPAALEKGGGKISVNTASSVRAKLNQAKHDGEVLHERKMPKANKARPMSAPAQRKKDKASTKAGREIASQAKTLMSSLQKLNPAVLF